MSDVPPEPGLGRHEWEARYEQLQPSLRDEPEEALPELADLVEDMLNERQLAPDDEVLAEETEQISSFQDARELAERARQGDELPPGDVAFAIRELREFYASLIEERRAP